MTGVAMALAASGKQPAAVSITGGAGAAGLSNGHTFPNATVTIGGGVGPFTTQWYSDNNTLGNSGTWTNPVTGLSQPVGVSGVFAGDIAQAEYWAIVTDTGAGNSRYTTSHINYQYTNTHGIV